MFQVLVVDDQKLIRDGVNAILSNSDLEIDAIYLAGNGIEALKIMERHSVDLVITDIRMPDMDGLQLMEQSKSRFPEASFLIISGYDDFKYAQKAIEYGAKAYLLKPIEREPLLKSAEKIQEELRLRDTMARQEHSQLQQKVQLEQFELEQYMEGREMPPNTLPGLAKKFPVFCGHYLLCIIGVPNIRLNASDVNPVARIRSVVLQRLAGKQKVCLEYHNYVLYAAEAGTDADAVMKELERSGIKAVSAVCGLFKGLALLPAACAQVRDLYNHRFLFPDKAVLSPEDINKLSELYTIPYHDIEHLMHIIGNCTNMDIEAYIGRVFHRDTLCKYRIGYTLDLCDNVYRCLKSIEKVIRPYMEEPVIDINKRHSLLDYENMREYLKTLRYQIQKMNDLFREFKISYKDNNDMNKAIAYINMNYQRPLTLAMVSNTVSLNYAYFSNVFKKYTGQSFLEYLRSVRVEKAKKLLAETEDKIAEISEKAGYDNYKNFARAFKEETGVTPVEYRRKIQMIQ